MSGSKLGGWWWKSYLKLANIIEPVSNAVFLHVSIIPSSYLAFCTVASWTVFPILLGKFHSPLPTQFLVLLSGLWQFWQTFAARRLQCRDTPGWSILTGFTEHPTKHLTLPWADGNNNDSCACVYVVTFRIKHKMNQGLLPPCGTSKYQQKFGKTQCKS